MQTQALKGNLETGSSSADYLPICLCIKNREDSDVDYVDHPLAGLLNDVYRSWAGRAPVTSRQSSTGSDQQRSGTGVPAGSSRPTTRSATDPLPPNPASGRSGQMFSFTFPMGGAGSMAPGGIELPMALEGIFQQLLSGRAPGAGVAGSLPQNFDVNFHPLLQVLHGNPGDYAWGSGGLDTIITQLLNNLDGSGPPPMPSHDIAKIPSVEITEEDTSKNLQCTVCMEDFVLKEPVRQLPCSHKFHNDCIVPWLEMHGSCPICRKLFNSSPSNNPSHSDSNDPTNSSSTQSGNNATTGRTDRSSSSRYQDINDYD